MGTWTGSLRLRTWMNWTRTETHVRLGHTMVSSWWTVVGFFTQIGSFRSPVRHLVPNISCDHIIIYLCLSGVRGEGAVSPK